MPTILIVNSTGEIKELNVKSFDESELYKKAGLKTNTNFEKQTEWGLSINDKKYNICLYGKTVGRAGQENKYEFPPPVDTTLYFGSCVLVNCMDDVVSHLSKPEWTKIYEELYGGFEDIGSEDTDDDDSDEDACSLDLPVTKEGYVKDGFIVSEDEEEADDEEYEEYEEDEEKEKVIVRSKSEKSKQPSKSEKSKQPSKSDKSEKPKKSSKEKSSSTNENIVNPPVYNNYLDCKDELDEEDYC